MNVLDKNNINIKNYFSEFVKEKSMSELLDYDNKLFDEIKKLENEKQILVTQNYKKFIVATDTINDVRFFQLFRLNRI